MANWIIKNVKLVGVSACVPKKTLHTEDMTIFHGDECEKFLNTVGIKSRRIAPSGVCASDLCYEAANKLIAELDWDKNEIDALIFVSITADYRSPMTSCILQNRLGLSNSCFTLDIPLACCGYLHGITVLSNIMSNGRIHKALLLCGDTCFQMSSPEDKSRYPIFGDAGTASAFIYDDTAKDIISYSYTDGSGYKAIITPHSGFRHPITPESFIMQDISEGIRRAPIHSMLDGMEVFSFAISKVPKSIKELMEQQHISQNDVDYFLLHQANRLINQQICKKLKIESPKVPSNIEEFGNTSCATIPLLMVTRLKQKLSTQSLNLILSAFGVGLTWGCINIKTDKIICPPLIEL